MGYPQIGLPYDRAARIFGRTKFNLPALLRPSIDGICSQSTRPIQYITTFGLFHLVVERVTNHAVFVPAIARGFATLVLLMLNFGEPADTIGVIGEYVGRIYNNGRSGPLTIIADRIEHNSADHR